jgi:hypothetical protein
MYAGHDELAKLMPPADSSQASESSMYWDTDSLTRVAAAGPVAIPSVSSTSLPAPTLASNPTNMASAKPQGRLASILGIISDSMPKSWSSDGDSQVNLNNESAQASVTSKLVDPQDRSSSIKSTYRDSINDQVVPDYRDSQSMSSTFDKKINFSTDEMYG